MSQRQAQRERILGILLAARGQWVPLPQITECAAQYNARIFELRRLGFRITNRTQDVNGVRHSWFRLEAGPTQPVVTPIPSVERAPETIPLFASDGGGL